MGSGMPLPKPVGRQHEVLYLPADGHSVVLGTAGSGKTLVAILRAAYLAKSGTPHAGPTLLVTFNNALVKYLRHIGSAELGDVTVETYHKFARGYLNSRIGFPRRNAVASGRARNALIRSAIQTVAAAHVGRSTLERPILFFDEEFHWISSHCIDNRSDYVRAKRVGRGDSTLRREDRPLVYEVFKKYEELREQSGYPYDWDEVANAAHRELASDTKPRRYRHIVIDEGQDLTPQMLRSLVLAASDDGSVTFFGDYAQQIYGSRMSWRDVGFQIRKVEEFAENYRNSAPIARLALAIGAMPYFKDVPDLVEPTSPKAIGPKPALQRFDDERSEMAFVNRFVERQSQRRSVAVLFRKRADERLLGSALRSKAIRLHKDMERFFTGPGLYYGTYHAAKGLEFDLVVMPLCSAERLPDPDEVAAFGEGEASATEGRLIYVGVTRARQELVITHNGVVSPLLPAERSLYQLGPSL